MKSIKYSGERFEFETLKSEFEFNDEGKYLFTHYFYKYGKIILSFIGYKI